MWWNIDQAGRWAFDDLQAALWQVHLATGLDFSFGGETDRIPQLADYDEARPPERPSLTIAWAKPGAVRGGSDLLDPEALRASVPRNRPTGSEGMAVGIGGWRGTGLRWGDDEPWAWCITSAHVVIDSTLRELSPPGFGVGNCRGAVLLHELAHAVGLGHVDEPTELMYPVVTDKPAAYGPGDLEGLRRVGEAAGPVF